MRHYVTIRVSTDVDDELGDWLQEAHDVVGLQAPICRTGRPSVKRRSKRVTDRTGWRRHGEVAA